MNYGIPGSCRLDQKSGKMMVKVDEERKTDLDPCPFCGGKPIEDWEREDREGDEIGPIISWSYYCTKCYAEVFSCQSREDAQEKWNRRVKE